MASSLTVLTLISSIRETHPQMEYIFKNGGCYQMYLILKAAFPDAKCHYDGNHVITRIGASFYDISGVVRPIPPPPIIDERVQSRAHRWCKGQFWKETSHE